MERLTQADLNNIEARGSNLETINQQIKNFEKKFPFLPLIEPAVINNGIIKLEDNKVDDYIDLFDEKIANGTKALKFVPASGAASRMFKDLFAAKDKLEQGASQKQIEQDKTINKFITNIKKFAFYTQLSETLKNEVSESNLKEVLTMLLTEKGLNYGSLPKGLLKFHNYDDCARTPFEEHCVEGALYARNSNNNIQIHFTVSPEHKAEFEKHLNEVVAKYEKMFNIRYNIEFSIQKSATDTIAVTPDNKPFRKNDGTILFRPAGHGALIENLNDLNADIIFIKNIDNVVPDSLKNETVRYKKALAGLLLEIQSIIYKYQEAFQNNTVNEMSEEYINRALLFMETKLNTKLPKDIKNRDDKYTFLKEKFNRPIRICGMVRNEGEPGGGPFWALNSDKSISLQIVESSQIDMNSKAQKNIASSASHFNPVDLVCAIKNYKGSKFDLLKYIDANTGFISEKSLNGRNLKAQELPGLWNGAMSNWTTLFVEVPIITFNPVKTINDLLRNEHQ